MTPPRGVSGWLAVFRAFCLLGGFFYLFSVVEWALFPAGEWERLAQLAPPVVQFRMFSRFQSVLIAAGLWWTFSLLVRPRSTTALWALLTLCILVALDVVGFALQESFISAYSASMQSRGEPTAAGDFTEARSHAVLGIAAGLAWIAYLLRSRRVANTWGPQSLGAMFGWIRGGFRAPASP